ncbi:DUF4145 domain-containing protein [Mesorhizobium sp. B3-1-7]|uniref:DUF4145 domain-containing protein n=1 Tax=Mesorhizobium sp. B3-1-7 TaxID=2589894 RepID=UPI001128AED9|nr:DUF4145 domain-containing protein [Mesorhizobium sp. B3-1-7]TPI60274.1 DUF4145 domain-containing protein [Mesorhizobium sp. B3-1-7]
MASTRELWGETFSKDEIPPYPCPLCNRGTLHCVPDSFRQKISRDVEEQLETQWIDPPDAVHQFNLFLQCGIAKCGAIVSVQGDSQLVERDNREFVEDRYFYRLAPQGMYPAPPLAAVPKDTPKLLKKEFETAFALFWIDLGACANRLRIIVEKILDHQRVPAARDLATRIASFKNSEPDHATMFDALRFVGNIGSHEGKASRDTVLDCFELLQEAIGELFDQRKSKLASMKQRIVNAKGRV